MYVYVVVLLYQKVLRLVGFVSPNSLIRYLTKFKLAKGYLKNKFIVKEKNELCQTHLNL